MKRGTPTPPMEDSSVKISTSSSGSSSARRHTNSKVTKPAHRNAKCSNTHAAHSPVHEHLPSWPHSGSRMGRHKRVWKACERCRMKKIKCDGEFPCKRCKDDSLVCTAGTRKKTVYKQLPRGYAEVLENTQFALSATVHKLYAMVRSSQQWDLGEPEFNDRGQPVIHDIAAKLGCIRLNADADLPPHSVFPEDEAGLAKLAAELEVQQSERESQASVEVKSEAGSTCNHTDGASSSELDHSDFEQDDRKVLISGCNNVQTLSPKSFTSYDDFDQNTVLTTDIDSAPAMFPVQPPLGPTSHQSWNIEGSASMDMAPQYIQNMDVDMAETMLNQGLVGSEFGTIKPHMISCPNLGVMLGVGDPMIYSGYKKGYSG
ncbi:Alpha/Beta hydrolase protein [Apiospora arundinis]